MMGVAGDDETAAAVADRLAAAGAEGRRADAAALVEAAPDAVVAVGTEALGALVDAGVEASVLPVDCGPELDAVASADAPAAAERVAAWLEDGGDGPGVERRAYPLLAVTAAGGRVGRAALDVLLVRSEPGRISEYGVSAEGRLARFRADGVVVATPAGSAGYAAAAGGPRLARGVGAVAVVPVAPFALGANVWVVDPTDGVELAVERDEGAVSLLLDGRDVLTLDGRSSVALSPDGSLEVVRPVDG